MLIYKKVRFQNTDWGEKSTVDNVEKIVRGYSISSEF